MRLNLAGDLQVVVHALFLAGFEIDRLVIQREGGLLEDGAEDVEVLVAEGRAHRTIRETEDAEDFAAIDERADDG